MSERPSGQRYISPMAHARMRDYGCPECGNPPAVHSDDTRFWVPRECDLTRAGAEERIAAYEWDRAHV